MACPGSHSSAGRAPLPFFPTCRKHCPSPIGARGWASRWWAGGPPSNRRDPGSCSEYFDKNMGNTWGVFRLKPAGPALSMGSPTAGSPERSLCAPGAHAAVLPPCLPHTRSRPLLRRLDRARETPWLAQLALGLHPPGPGSHEAVLDGQRLPRSQDWSRGKGRDSELPLEWESGGLGQC